MPFACTILRVSKVETHIYNQNTENNMMKKIAEYWTPLTVDVVYTLVVLLLSLLAYRALRSSMRAWARHGHISTGVVTLLIPIIRWSILIVMLLVLLQHFQVLHSAWATVTGILAMVAIGLVAVWSVLSNAMCTILLLIFKPFNMGDKVNLPSLNIQGDTVDINFVYTTLREENGSLVRIPNNMFFQNVVRIVPGSHPTALTEQLDRRMTDEELLRLGQERQTPKEG